MDFTSEHTVERFEIAGAALGVFSALVSVMELLSLPSKVESLSFAGLFI